MKYICLISIPFILFFTSCKEKGCTDVFAYNFNIEAEKDDGSCLYKDSLIFNFRLTYNSQAIYQYEIFENNGKNFRLERYSAYISNISLNDSEIRDVHLHNIENSSTESFSTSLDNSKVSTLSFALGLNEEMNNSDPNSFPIDHPLSITQNTYWQMEPASYIFVKLELKVDSLGGDYFNYPLTYHLAHNDLYREINFPIQLDSENKFHEITLNLAIDQILNNIDIHIDLPHSSNSSPLANSLTDNMVDAFYIE